MAFQEPIANEYGELVRQPDNGTPIEGIHSLLSSIQENPEIKQQFARLSRLTEGAINDEGFPVEGYVERVSQLKAMSDLLQVRFGEEIVNMQVVVPFAGNDVSAAIAWRDIGIEPEQVTHIEIDDDLVQAIRNKGFQAKCGTAFPQNDEEIVARGDIMYVMNAGMDDNKGTYEEKLQSLVRGLKEGGILIGNVADLEEIGLKFLGRTFYNPDINESIFVFDGQAIPEDYKTNDRDNNMKVYMK